MSFHYRALDDETVRAVRTTLRDRHGNALTARVADDSAPCRACLRIMPAGTPVILFAHRPFATGGPYAETGPVFVHAAACEPYRERAHFPVEFRPRRLTFRAYDAAGAIRTGEIADGTAAETVLERCFADPDIAFVHVRSPAWGCYDFTVERD